MPHASQRRRLRSRVPVSSRPFWLQGHPDHARLPFSMLTLLSYGTEQTTRTSPQNDSRSSFHHVFPLPFLLSLFRGLSTSVLASTPDLLPVQTVWFSGGRCLVLLAPSGSANETRSVSVLMDGAYRGKVPWGRAGGSCLAARGSPSLPAPLPDLWRAASASSSAAPSGGCSWSCPGRRTAFPSSPSEARCAHRAAAAPSWF